MNEVRAFAMTFVFCLAAAIGIGAVHASEMKAAPGAILYVDVDNASGTEDGTSWATAYTTIGAAMTASNSGDQIWVAEGTYAELVTMKANVDLYGGFSGPGATFADRDPATYPTVIDGDNVRQCAVGAENARLDGFTLYDGNSASNGGGMRNINVSNTIANCVFLSCHSATWGGAVTTGGAGPVVFEDCRFEGNSSTTLGGGAVFHGAGEATFRRCVFSGNTAIGLGGGVQLGSTPDSRGVFEDCAFIGNEVTGTGGAIVVSTFGEAELVRCLFVKNIADEDGGGVYSYAPLTVEACEFSRNEANEGGGIYQHAGTLSVTDSRFSGNNAAFDGGGLYQGGDSTATLTRCSFFGNNAKDGNGGGICGDDTSHSRIVEVLFVGNHAGSLGGGLNHDGAALEVSDATFKGNTSEERGGGFYTNNVDAVFGGCTVQGNRTGSLGGGGTCFAGAPQFTDCVFEDNTGGGGAMFFSIATVTFENTIFRRNHSEAGGALSLDNTNTTCINCLFHDNDARLGGAIGQYANTLTLNHCTLALNAAEEASAIYGSGTRVLNVTNSIIRENTGGVPLTTTGVTTTLTNSDLPTGPNYSDSPFDEDVLFYAPEYGDFRLQAGSPCIDACASTTLTEDLRGFSRVGLADMGAYERQAVEDFDGDGIPDDVEGLGDTDGDGTPDYQDDDSDNDGIPDAMDGLEDFDDDGIPNFQDDDTGTPIPGDINGDGAINAIDVQLVVNGALGIPLE